MEAPGIMVIVFGLSQIDLTTLVQILPSWLGL